MTNAKPLKVPYVTAETLDSELDGWLRPVRARNADSKHRFRPSDPTARSDSRIFDKADRK